MAVLYPDTPGVSRYFDTYRTSLHTVYRYVAKPEIAVGHWPFSDQFQDLAEQK